MRKLAESTCERCGTTFGCGANAGSCWCAEVTVPDDVAGQLSRTYERCLCPACLREVAVATLDREASQQTGGDT